MAFLVLILILLIILMAFLAFLLISLAFYWLKLGVPFAVSRTDLIEKLIKEVSLEEGKVFYDLGSGDGNFLYYLAKKHPKVRFVGYELNFALYLFSRFFCRINNLSFYRRNFFNINLRNADYLYLFLFPEVMNRLLPKLKKELKTGAVVIANSFHFDGLKSDKIFPSEKRLGTLYLYKF